MTVCRVRHIRRYKEEGIRKKIIARQGGSNVAEV